MTIQPVSQSISPLRGRMLEEMAIRVETQRGVSRAELSIAHFDTPTVLSMRLRKPLATLENAVHRLERGYRNQDREPLAISRVGSIYVPEGGEELLVEDTSDRPISPSAFMRGLRPEYYSDTQDRTTIVLEREVLENHLATITNRNETQDFELFCRKLCERTLCPNLRPATGSHGGGDSKADTETIPVAEEISALWYVGDQGAAKERWAFGFSAKKKWVEKVRSDVAGLVERNRRYRRIICVTNQFAPDKARAKLEDELTQEYGISITVLDRTWIVKEIVEHERKDLAFDYLHIGHEVRDTRRLGPQDYSRAVRLEALEKEIEDPTAFDGIERQRAAAALVAGKLSRSLERPRVETDGRFQRAIRLAAAHGYLSAEARVTLRGAVDRLLVV